MNTNQIEMTELSVNEIKKTETATAKKKRLAAEAKKARMAKAIVRAGAAGDARDRSIARKRIERMEECLKWLEGEERKQAEQEMKEKVERFNAKYFPNNNPRVWA